MATATATRTRVRGRGRTRQRRSATGAGGQAADYKKLVRAYEDQKQIVAALGDQAKFDFRQYETACKELLILQRKLDNAKFEQRQAAASWTAGGTHTQRGFAGSQGNRLARRTGGPRRRGAVASMRRKTHGAARTGNRFASRMQPAGTY